MATALLDGFSYKDRYHIISHAAYIARETLHNDITNKDEECHATTKDDIVCTKVMAPAGADKKYNDVEVLWNEVLQTGYLRSAKGFFLGLPYEATMEQRIEMLENFLNDTFVKNGYIVQYSIHDEKINEDTGEGNHNIHAHVAVTDMKCRLNNETGKLELVKKGSENGKSSFVYVDKDGNEILPTPQPRLKKGKLVYDKNGNIIYKERIGYKELLFDDDGKPLLNDDGTPVIIDRRVKTEIGKDGRQNFAKKNIPVCEFDKNYGIKKLRERWEFWHNKQKH